MRNKFLFAALATVLITALADSNDSSDLSDTNINAKNVSELVGSKFCIKSANGAYLNPQHDFMTTIVMAPAEDVTCEQWHFEQRQGGKVALRAESSGEKYPKFLTASFNENWREFNVSKNLEHLWNSTYVCLPSGSSPSYDTTWTPVNDEDGSWSFRTNGGANKTHGEWLSAREEWNRIEVRSDLGPNEHFWMERKTELSPLSGRHISSWPKLGTFCIESIYETRLRATKGLSTDEWKLETTPKNESCQAWSISENRGSHVALKLSEAGKYLRARGDGTVELVDDKIMWFMFEHFDGSWSFQRAHYNGTWTYHWLRVDQDGRVNTSTSKLLADEQFRLVDATDFSKPESDQVNISTPSPSTATPPLNAEFAQVNSSLSSDDSSHENTTTTPSSSNIRAEPLIAQTNNDEESSDFSSALFIPALIVFMIICAVIYSISRSRRTTAKRAHRQRELVVRHTLLTNDAVL